MSSLNAAASTRCVVLHERRFGGVGGLSPAQNPGVEDLEDLKRFSEQLNAARVHQVPQLAGAFLAECRIAPT